MTFKLLGCLFPDNAGFFELLAMIVDEEPAQVFGPLERWLMQAIGIVKGTPFNPDDNTKAVLGEAARLGGAMARVNTYASPAPDVYFYPDRKWQGALAGVSYTFLNPKLLLARSANQGLSWDVVCAALEYVASK